MQVCASRQPAWLIAMERGCCTDRTALLQGCAIALTEGQGHPVCLLLCNRVLHAWCRDGVPHTLVPEAWRGACQPLRLKP